MPFSNEYKALIKNLYQFTKDTDAISEDKMQRGRTGHFTEKDSGKRKH